MPTEEPNTDTAAGTTPAEVITTANEAVTPTDDAEKSVDSKPLESETILGADDVDTATASGTNPEDKAKEDPVADEAVTVPETYADFDLPEGYAMNPEYMTGMTPIFKELGLSQESAQKLIESHVAQVQASEGERVDSFNQVKQEWLESAKTDKDIGGDRFERTVQSARAALAQFGTPELNGLLRDYGIGNHPELLRIFGKIGGLLSEDQPGTLSNPVVRVPDTVDDMYPDDKPAA